MTTRRITMHIGSVEYVALPKQELDALTHKIYQLEADLNALRKTPATTIVATSTKWLGR